MAGIAINFGPVAPGSPMLKHPFYQKWSYSVLSTIDGTAINAMKADLLKMKYNNDSAEIIAYGINLIRTITVLTS